MSDGFNRTLVILIFLISYMYMNFITLQIKTQSGWSNLTCNPLNLFVNSLFQSKDDANKDFERCIVNLSSATTTNLFKNQKEEQENALAKLSSIKTEYSELTNNVKQYVVDASNLTQEYTQQINELEKSQNNANDLNTNTSNKVKTYLGYLQSSFQDIVKFFQKPQNL